MTWCRTLQRSQTVPRSFSSPWTVQTSIFEIFSWKIVQTDYEKNSFRASKQPKQAMRNFFSWLSFMLAIMYVGGNWKKWKRQNTRFCSVENSSTAGATTSVPDLVASSRFKGRYPSLRRSTRASFSSTTCQASGTSVPSTLAAKQGQ